MAVLAKMEDGDFYPDLLSEGFVSGPVVACPECDCEYRVFYSSDETPASVVRASADIPSLDRIVVQSHPQHARKRIRVGEGD
jgi:hypothetical protein